MPIHPTLQQSLPLCVFCEKLLTNFDSGRKCFECGGFIHDALACSETFYDEMVTDIQEKVLCTKCDQQREQVAPPGITEASNIIGDQTSINAANSPPKEAASSLLCVCCEKPLTKFDSYHKCFDCRIMNRIEPSRLQVGASIYR